MVCVGRRKKEDGAAGESAATSTVLSANGVKEDMTVVEEKMKTTAPCRLTVDLPRSLFNTLIAFVVSC
jgi:hypothetical protein